MTSLENIEFILPPEVDIDSHEEDEQDDEERPPVKSHRHPPISPALRVRETLEYGREGDDESEDDEGAAEEADLLERFRLQSYHGGVLMEV